MAKKAPEKFIEFDSQAEAEKHEQFVAAQREYERAREVFARAVYESQRTADGEPFRMSLMVDYWFVSEYFGFPELRRVSFQAWNLTFDEQQRGEILVSRTRENGFTEERPGFIHYPINELYRFEKNARRALLAAQKKWLHEKAAAVNKLEQEIKGSERG